MSMSSTVNITNTTLSGNSATSNGGGICSYYGTLIVTNSGSAELRDALPTARFVERPFDAHVVAALLADGGTAAIA